MFASRRADIAAARFGQRPARTGPAAPWTRSEPAATRARSHGPAH